MRIICIIIISNPFCQLNALFIDFFFHINFRRHEHARVGRSCGTDGCENRAAGRVHGVAHDCLYVSTTASSGQEIVSDVHVHVHEFYFEGSMVEGFLFHVVCN